MDIVNVLYDLCSDLHGLHVGPSSLPSFYLRTDLVASLFFGSEPGAFPLWAGNRKITPSSQRGGSLDMPDGVFYRA